MLGRRVSVGTLAAGSAAIAGLVGAVSLTRVAGTHLGFPPGLEWTLTGAVDVAGVAGGVMWTAFKGRVRRIGQPMNIVCTAVSGLGVGLDHAANARPTGPWPWIAFAVGLFIPLLFTWITHALAVIGDQAPAARRRGWAARVWEWVRGWVSGRAVGERLPAAAAPAPVVSRPPVGEPPAAAPAAVAPPAAPAAGAGKAPVEAAIEWALRELASGQTAGWSRIRTQHPELSEHYAKSAAKEARRRHEDQTRPQLRAAI